MDDLVLVVDSYFDGRLHHAEGPYTIAIAHGAIRRILQGDADRLKAELRRTCSGDAPQVGTRTLRTTFAMPGLVEAHCHLFLDGANLDAPARKAYLSAGFEEMTAVGRKSIEQNLAAGITLIRDAGDIHGVNTVLKAGIFGGGLRPEIRSPGRALRKAGRYGSFMAVEVRDRSEIARAVRELARTADDLKILLTGIIDFEKGEMKGGVQFDLDDTKLLVSSAREMGLKTYAHCSGHEGLHIAVEAGIESIEHGFFMEKEVLKVMADKQIAWVPTFSPVAFQHQRPELAGWSAAAVGRLEEILRHHSEFVAIADDMGVPVVAGSDAGSFGVPHGQGLIDDLLFLRNAGMPVERTLAAGTSVPRRLWNAARADLVEGAPANLVALAGSPFADMNNLRKVQMVIRHLSTFVPSTATAAGIVAKIPSAT